MCGMQTWPSGGGVQLCTDLQSQNGRIDVSFSSTRGRALVDWTATSHVTLSPAAPIVRAVVRCAVLNGVHKSTWHRKGNACQAVAEGDSMSITSIVLFPDPNTENTNKLVRHGRDQVAKLPILESTETHNLGRSHSHLYAFLYLL